ncbi:hypothetical protein MRO55_13730 [Escherichia coli]|nr:hypothetical protein [Escherichia coli]EIH1035882.1 hypothetical protein [Escherichia coli]MCQ7027751.1 hypothetical protein [Escherichia coli]
MNVYEMEGFLRGKCLPGDMKVNESNAQYLVRKLSELQSQNADMAVQLANAVSKCRELAAENAALKNPDNWLSQSDYGYEASEVATQNGATKDKALRAGVLAIINRIETPATDAFLAEVRAQGVTEYASKRGFSFQHGSIHANFGNGDVMVGSVTFENGDAGINFAPVREKTGGVGTSYEWTNGKTTEQVDSVFTIASSNSEGLEVIRDKLSEAIAQLRKGAAL